jgi:hypothetical protein
MAPLEAVFFEQREDRADRVSPTEALNAPIAVIGKKLAATVGTAAQGPEPWTPVE